MMRDSKGNYATSQGGLARLQHSSDNLSTSNIAKIARSVVSSEQNSSRKKLNSVGGDSSSFQLLQKSGQKRTRYIGKSKAPNAQFFTVGQSFKRSSGKLPKPE